MYTNRKPTLFVLLLGIVLSLITVATMRFDRPVETSGGGPAFSARDAQIALDIYHASERGASPGRTDAAALEIYHQSEWSGETFDRNAAAMEIYWASERGK
jgi:hypothetical protein